MSDETLAIKNALIQEGLSYEVKVHVDFDACYDVVAGLALAGGETLESQAEFLFHYLWDATEAAKPEGKRQRRPRLFVDKALWVQIKAFQAIHPEWSVAAVHDAMGGEHSYERVRLIMTGHYDHKFK
jgi:hypothetical protein